MTPEVTVEEIDTLIAADSGFVPRSALEAMRAHVVRSQEAHERFLAWVDEQPEGVITFEIVD